MSRNYLFQNNKRPKNYEVIDNPGNNKKLLATKFNTEISEIVHLLIGNSNGRSVGQRYQLYNWNITSNLLELNFMSPAWDCSVKCQISASGSYFLMQDQKSCYLYSMNSRGLINKLLMSFQKNKVSILDESASIRKKADLSKKNFVYASGKDLLTLSFSNNTLILNIFPLPLMYNFNPNNFVLDTKLYQNKLYILYRSISTYNIYLYEFKQVQLLFQQFPNNTKLIDTGITISQVFRFNNNYISKVIRFVRGVDLISGNMIIWVYNQNQAYKCANAPCIGFGYQVYSNIVFSAVTATNYTIAFYGKSNMVDLKNFKDSLFSEELGRYYFELNVTLTDILSYNNYTITKLLVSNAASIYPTIYTLANDCKALSAFEDSNFCKCTFPYVYDLNASKCIFAINMESLGNLDNVYIALIAICSILLLTLIFIIYKRIIKLHKVRKSWQYNASQNIIFQ